MTNFFATDLLEVLDSKTAIKVMEQLVVFVYEDKRSPYGVVIHTVVEINNPDNRLMEYTFVEFSTVGFTNNPPVHYTLSMHHGHKWECANIYFKKTPIATLINEVAGFEFYVAPSKHTAFDGSKLMASPEEIEGGK